MANASFHPFKSGLMGGDIDLLTATIKVALVRGYTYDSSHDVMADITTAGGVLNGTPAELTAKTVIDGVFNAAQVTITTTANASPHHIIVYQASAVTGGADVAPGSQLLCFYFDTGTNLPVVPGTGTVTIAWSTGTAKIYKIG